ncbi:MAG: hypothetical protein R3245_10870, partial [Kiloniellales bacterium]|nr:hypothetical protein [Kiloniellales bacterium]
MLQGDSILTRISFLSILSVVIALVWVAAGAQPALSQDFYTSGAAYDQSRALGRALFPEDDQNKVYLSDRFVSDNSALAPYSVTTRGEYLPGLQSLAEQSARTLVLRDVPKGRDRPCSSWPDFRGNLVTSQRILITGG